MDWSRPEFLYLILPLAAAWLVLSWWSRRARRRAAEAFVAMPMWSRILPAASASRFWCKLVLQEVAIVAGLVALAGPRFGVQYEEVIPRGSDLYVLIDVSRSMLAEDVPPSRLGRAKADVASLVNRLEGERVGLIAFAGQAVVKCPLTVDYDSFRRSLEELDPGSAPRGGTAIGDAIRKALEVFQPRAERDQAILLITDGDDQQSYPLDAAAVAAERQVTIFTVGLGDSAQGARVPKAGAPHTFVEYEGQQIWSKLDGSLLQDIALKTSGVYVPVGTRSYDLGELYSEHLKNRRGAADESRKRLRRSEQFQWFLGLSVLALLVDLVISPYARTVLPVAEAGDKTANSAAQAPATQPLVAAGKAGRVARVGCLMVLGSLLAGRAAGAAETTPAVENVTGDSVPASSAAKPPAKPEGKPAAAVRAGLQHYRAEEFEKARENFAAARQGFEKEAAAKAAIAAFDEACAAHRLGNVSQARDAYLQAGLAHDKHLAAAAHYNLGTMSAEEARRLAGAQPLDVPPEKRQEILDQLAGAVAAFRHSLDLQPGNSRARRDIELIRQWIRYYTEKWHERDRQKRREETNLLAFLEFLVQTQRSLRTSASELADSAPSDAFAELKRLQDELFEEIEPLKDKIQAELQPAPSAAGAPGSPPMAPATGSQPSETEQAIQMLQQWADMAGEKMSEAANRLGRRQGARAMAEQQAAIDELEKIWDAVVPFQPLLSRDLAEQTKLTRELAPPAESADSGEADSKKEPEEGEAGSPDEVPLESPGTEAAVVPRAGGAPQLATQDVDWSRLITDQQNVRRRTQLLPLKAQAELERLEQQPASATAAGSPATDPDPAAPAEPAEPGGAAAVDPEAAKAGFRKAIELAPQAAEKMQTAIQALEKHDRATAYPAAEEARRILEEIQKAQPQQQQQKQDQQDQQKQDQQKQDSQDQKDNDQQKSDDQKQDENQDQKENDKKPDDKESPKKPDDRQKSGGQSPKPMPMSRDQIEEALRKVRERQEEKRERDRKVKARVSGKVPVDKDW
ncbi:MAG: VWA domain-containing protein [Planctomycetes bacterium]|nr:VWA domain-containing protein [Planctomycetota bacterium]